MTTTSPTVQRTTDPDLGTKVVLAEPLVLQSGETLADVTMAYQAYGTLNADKSNVIVACHALTGDQFVCGQHPITGKRGWWDDIVGPGKVIDTNRY